MVGLLIATVTFTLIVAVLVAVLVAVTVVPVFAALQMADARRFSTTRWAVLSGVAVVVGLLLVYELHAHHVSRLVLLAPLLLTWAGPLTLWGLGFALAGAGIPQVLGSGAGAVGAGVAAVLTAIIPAAWAAAGPDRKRGS